MELTHQIHECEEFKRAEAITPGAALGTRPGPGRRGRGSPSIAPSTLGLRKTVVAVCMYRTSGIGDNGIQYIAFVVSDNQSRGAVVSNDKTFSETADAGASTGQPMVRKIGTPDLMDALAKGYDDFKANPSHLILCIMIYPVVTLVFARIGAGYEILPMIWPLFSGLALVGPLIAMGLYEMSRRREQGLKVSLKDGFRVLHSPSIGAILVLSLSMIAIFLGWLMAANAIYRLVFSGGIAVEVGDFVQQIFFTARGLELMIVGTGVGFLFAVLVLCISVVSFPLLLDRKVSALTAVRTSARVVFANPVTMAIWGLIIAGLLFVGCLPVFVGLAVVIPVLGHSTWHLYRKVVA